MVDGTRGVSGFAAPIMAGRLLGFDVTQLSHALSLSLARAATSAMVRVADVCAAKSLANALVAQNAMQACLLAQHGATGPMPLFEHARALQSVFPNLSALGSMLAPLDEPQVIRAARIKDYPCLATGQTVAAAGIAMREKIGARMDIVSIEIAMADTRQIRQHLIDPSRNDPRTREAADHSYQFIFGAGLIDGDLGLAQFEKQLWNDPRMRDVMSRVKLSCDPAINSLAPDGFPCRVRARMMTGEVVEVIVKHPPGYSAQGLDEAAVIAKFERLASPHVARDRRARVVETCLRARNLASIGEMMSLLGA